MVLYWRIYSESVIFSLLQLIRPEDMTSSESDELSMITYLSQFPHAKVKPGAPLRARIKVYGSGLDSKGNIVDQSTSFTVETFSPGTLEISVTDPDGHVVEVGTILPTKSDSDVMFYLQSYLGLIINISLVY